VRHGSHNRGQAHEEDPAHDRGKGREEEDEREKVTGEPECDAQAGCIPGELLHAELSQPGEIDSFGIDHSPTCSRRISSRNAGPYFSRLNSPTPKTAPNPAISRGRATASSRRVRSGKITYGGTPSSSASSLRRAFRRRKRSSAPESICAGAFASAFTGPASGTGSITRQWPLTSSSVRGVHRITGYLSPARARKPCRTSSPIQVRYWALLYFFPAPYAGRAARPYSWIFALFEPRSTSAISSIPKFAGSEGPGCVRAVHHVGGMVAAVARPAVLLRVLLPEVREQELPPAAGGLAVLCHILEFF